MARKKTDADLTEMGQQPLDMIVFKPLVADKIALTFSALKERNSLDELRTKFDGQPMRPYTKYMFVVEGTLGKIDTTFGTEEAIGGLEVAFTRFLGVIKPVVEDTEADASEPDAEETPASEPETGDMIVDKETGEILDDEQIAAEMEAEDLAGAAMVAEAELERMVDEVVDELGADETLAEGGTDQFENDLPAKPELPCSCFATWEDISECRGCKQVDPCRIYTEAGVA